MPIKRTALSHEVEERICALGFPEDFALLVGQQMNTDFTARMMVGYLRDGEPRTMEDIADELLGILAFRDSCIQKRIASRHVFADFGDDNYFCG